MQVQYCVCIARLFKSSVSNVNTVLSICEAIKNAIPDFMARKDGGIGLDVTELKLHFLTSHPFSMAPPLKTLRRLKVDLGANAASLLFSLPISMTRPLLRGHCLPIHNFQRQLTPKRLQCPL